MPHPYFDVARPVVLGHRGCAGEMPENTLESFAAGLEAGAGMLESDVHLTRDGIPVLIHDDDTARVADAATPVRDLTLAELQALDAGHTFEDAGGGHPFRGRGLRVPSLEEALARFPEARFNLELKEDLPGMVERTAGVVARAGAAQRTLLTAGEPLLMARIHAHLDACGLDCARGASAADVLAFVRSALDDASAPNGPMALQVPAEFGGRPLVTERFVTHAHRHGIQVHVWTVNEVAEMERLLGLGVDGLVTDFPGRMAALLGARAAPR